MVSYRFQSKIFYSHLPILYLIASKRDGKQDALRIALACSDAPTGRTTWTMQLLADQVVTLQVVDAISDETVRRILKKTI